MTEIFYGNCLEVMRGLSDKSIDCFICDLPYGQLSKTTQLSVEESIKRYKCATRLMCCPWDVKIDLVEFWKQVERLAKNDNSPVLHFCNTRFGIDLINSKPDWFRYDLVWNKERGVSFLTANKMPMKSHEMIYVFSKKGAYYNRIDIPTDKKAWTKNDLCNTISKQYGCRRIATQSGGENGDRCPLSVINVNKSSGRNGHPTEKPKELYEWLLRRYCPEGGTVLDPTAGSFNSILVARELGLNGIGIEMDEEFFRTALDKFNNLDDVKI